MIEIISNYILSLSHIIHSIYPCEATSEAEDPITGFIIVTAAILNALVTDSASEFDYVIKSLAEIFNLLQILRFGQLYNQRYGFSFKGFEAVNPMMVAMYWRIVSILILRMLVELLPNWYFSLYFCIYVYYYHSLGVFLREIIYHR